MKDNRSYKIEKALSNYNQYRIFKVINVGEIVEFKRHPGKFKLIKITKGGHYRFEGVLPPYENISFTDLQIKHMKDDYDKVLTWTI